MCMQASTNGRNSTEPIDVRRARMKIELKRKRRYVAPIVDSDHVPNVEKHAMIPLAISERTNAGAARCRILIEPKLVRRNFPFQIP